MSSKQVPTSMRNVIADFVLLFHWKIYHWKEIFRQNDHSFRKFLEDFCVHLIRKSIPNQKVIWLLYSFIDEPSKLPFSCSYNRLMLSDFHDPYNKQYLTTNLQNLLWKLSNRLTPQMMLHPVVINLTSYNDLTRNYVT